MTDPYYDQDDPDDYDPYDPDYDREPDEPDWAYDAWLYDYEAHCEQVHGGAHCDCRLPLRKRITRWLRNARTRLRTRRARYSDEPPF